MRKILSFLFMLFLFGIYNSAFSATLTTIYNGGPNTGTDCGSTRVPKDSDTYKAGSSYTCITHTYYSTRDYEKNTSKNSHTMCDGEDRVIGKNGTKIKCRRYDDINPTTSANNSSSSWRTSDIGITLSVADTGGSGLSIKKYRWDNSDCWNGTNFNNGNTITQSTNGTHTLYLCSRDVAGNSKTWNGTYRLDKIHPESLSITYNLGAIETGNYDITVKAKDRGTSKLKKIVLQESDNLGAWSSIKTWDNINSDNTLITKTYPKTNAANGHKYKYKIVAYDYANNTTTLEKPDIIKVIKTLTYEDNDNYARKIINGFIAPKQQKNIFWNNSRIEDYIDKNPNNVDIFNEKLGDVTSGFLHLEVSKQAELTLIKINKTRYKDFREFERIETLTGTISPGDGYIKNTSGILGLNSTTTGAYNFDFDSYDYILFLTNLETDQILNYTVIGETSLGKGIYLNPIDDSNSNNKGFKVLGYDVIIHKRGNIMGKMIEMVGKK